jgi:hypothetical protein
MRITPISTLAFEMADSGRVFLQVVENGGKIKLQLANCVRGFGSHLAISAAN